MPDMKSKGFEGIDSGIRSMILICVAVAYFAWDTGFQLGVYGRIFYDKIFFVWSMSWAMLLIFIIIPKRVLPVPPMLWVATAIPTLWLGVALAERAARNEILIREVMTISGALAVLACFPYVAFVAVSLLYPDFAGAPNRRAKYAVVAVIVLMVVAGYLIGINHERFMTCDDFRLSGQFVPADCSDR